MGSRATAVLTASPYLKHAPRGDVSAQEPASEVQRRSSDSLTERDLEWTSVQSSGSATPLSLAAWKAAASSVQRAAASAASCASGRPASSRKREYISRKQPPPVPRRSITW